MLPRISPDFHLKNNVAAYLAQLNKLDFTGDICSDYATRLSLAVDNSIYQVIPQAVIFPRVTNDIVIALKLASADDFRTIKFCPRGGGTSTNGQSLSGGIIIDCSRYMRNILDLDLAKKIVTVQPGVVLDQLNDFLREYGYCFAPEISPSNRATIGGMVNTDACGLGSKLIGRTSDHIENLTCVLASGELIETREATLGAGRQATLAAGQSTIESHHWHNQVLELIAPHTNLVEEKFRSTPRTLCGYNLQKSVHHLNYLFAGSEGTLAVIAACQLKLTPIPKYKKLLVLKYKTFDDALRAVELTDKFKPLAVEAIDEKLIALAREDAIYFYLKQMLDNEHILAGAINLIEFVSQSEGDLEITIKDFCASLELNKNISGHAYDYYLAKTPEESKLLWDLRKKAVGLISKKQQGTRRPIPFIEDTAVPPAYLADYIAEFRMLLDSYGLMYGMYGHVDAGCVHVRPALDMKLVADEKLIAALTEKVVCLIEKYQGVLWGEHGHGHRSEYGERFFGHTLYQVVRQIKTLFDPYNKLNPGKIAVPLDSTAALVKLTGPLRGQFDKQISDTVQQDFAESMTCNGNGACFNYATADVMCPSYKVTQDRIHSPKGRATVLREWLRQLSLKGYAFNTNIASSLFGKWRRHWQKKQDFSHEVYAAMSGCLACKGCASQCPLNVDIPDLKSKFLAIYHQRYLRSIRDYLIAGLEFIAPYQATFPRFTNCIMRLSITRGLIRYYFKLVDSPLMSNISVTKELKKRKARKFDFQQLQQLTALEKANTIILLQDTFSSYYESDILLQVYDFLTKLGLSVYVAPFFASGKPLHIKGFQKRFKKIAEKNSARLTAYAELNIPLLGIDPRITLSIIIP